MSRPQNTQVASIIGSAKEWPVLIPPTWGAATDRAWQLAGWDDDDIPGHWFAGPKRVMRLHALVLVLYAVTLERDLSTAETRALDLPDVRAWLAPVPNPHRSESALPTEIATRGVEELAEVLRHAGHGVINTLPRCDEPSHIGPRGPVEALWGRTLSRLPPSEYSAIYERSDHWPGPDLPTGLSLVVALTAVEQMERP